MTNIRLRDIEGYENFKAECEFFKCKDEYPGWTGIEKYGVITNKTLEELTALYPRIIEFIAPIVIMKPECSIARNESIANNKKHRRLQALYGEFFEYDDDIDCAKETNIVDPTDMALSLEISEAMQTLTETQRKRVILYFYQRMGYKEIAAVEQIDESSVRESIDCAIKKLQRYFC